MNSTSMNTESCPSAQAARILAFTHTSQRSLEPFEDGMEHLKALELESSLFLALAYVNRNKNGRKDHEDTVLPPFPLITHEMGAMEAQSIIERVAAENRSREAESTKHGIQLNFTSLCDEWALTRFERNVVMLLLMQYVAPDFISLFDTCKFERGRGNGMQIGTLLSLLCSNLKDQLECRRFFSVTGTLLNNEIIVMQGSVDDTTNILDETVCLHERYVRHIIGDDNLYNSFFKYIKREQSTISLDQVIMASNTKEEVSACVERYLLGRSNGTLEELDQFFGYGTALTFLFYGPSGTGKTMLARALAARFNRSIFTLTTDDMRTMPGSYDEILGTLFREAALQGAFVFLDECDDLFENNGHASRSLLIEIEKARCVVIMATNKPVDLDPALERRITMKVNFPLPDEELRMKMWQALMPPSANLASDVNLAEFANRYNFTGGLIRNSILLAITGAGMNGKNSQITAEELHHAAACQSATIADNLGLCRMYAPNLTIDNLSLRPRQRGELKNLAEVWRSLRTQRTGLAIVISSSDITSGIQAAEGLAQGCGLKVRSFDYQRIVSVSPDDRITDPVTQRKVLPLDYAFAPASCDASMTIFVDHEGLMGDLFERNIKNMGDLLVRDLLGRLRNNDSFFCMVTRDITPGKLPPEINLHIRLEHPAEEAQIRHWEHLLGGFAGCEEEIIAELTEFYPLHLSEIDFIYRQSVIMATIRRLSRRPETNEIQEVIEGYQQKKRTPLLFGGV